MNSSIESLEFWHSVYPSCCQDNPVCPLCYKQYLEAPGSRSEKHIKGCLEAISSVTLPAFAYCLLKEKHPSGLAAWALLKTYFLLSPTSSGNLHNDEAAAVLVLGLKISKVYARQILAACVSLYWQPEAKGMLRLIPEELLWLRCRRISHIKRGQSIPIKLGHLQRLHIFRSIMAMAVISKGSSVPTPRSYTAIALQRSPSTITRYRACLRAKGAITQTLLFTRVRSYSPHNLAEAIKVAPQHPHEFIAGSKILKRLPDIVLLQRRKGLPRPFKRSNLFMRKLAKEHPRRYFRNAIDMAHWAHLGRPISEDAVLSSGQADEPWLGVEYIGEQLPIEAQKLFAYNKELLITIGTSKKRNKAQGLLKVAQVLGLQGLERAMLRFPGPYLLPTLEPRVFVQQWRWRGKKYRKILPPRQCQIKELWFALSDGSRSSMEYVIPL